MCGGWPFLPAFVVVFGDKTYDGGRAPEGATLRAVKRAIVLVTKVRAVVAGVLSRTKEVDGNDGVSHGAL